MAKILGQEEQEKALKEIRTLIKDMETVNKFLRATSSDGMYQLSLKDASGKKFTTDLFCADKAPLDALVLDHKKRVTARIRDLAAKYRIELDPEDEEILGISEGDM